MTSNVQLLRAAVLPQPPISEISLIILKYFKIINVHNDYYDILEWFYN